MKFYPTLTLASALAITAASPAFGIVIEEEEEEEGVPHIVVGAADGALTLEFEIVEPLAGVTGPGGEELITLFLPQAQGSLAIAPSPLTGNVFASNPVSGLESGFANDDTGFEGEDLPTNADVNIRLISSDLADDVDFLFLFGSTVLSNADLELTGSGLTSAADIEGTFVFELSDSGASGLAPASFGLRLTADPAAAVVPEPATAGLLTLGGMTLALRRRRR